MNIDPILALYALPLAIVWTVYLGLRKRAEWRSITRRQAAAEAGLLEPPTLHPEIDPTRCIGCGACVRACPEGDILGLIDGAALIELGMHRPRSPSGARRRHPPGLRHGGVDIPMSASTLRPTSEYSSPASLAAWASSTIEQGCQAIDPCALDGLGRLGHFDVVIVGEDRRIFGESAPCSRFPLSLSSR